MDFGWIFLDTKGFLAKVRLVARAPLEGKRKLRGSSLDLSR